MKLLTKEQYESTKMQKSFKFIKKNLKINMWNIENIVKLKVIVIILGNIDVLDIAYVI